MLVLMLMLMLILMYGIRNTRLLEAGRPAGTKGGTKPNRTETETETEPNTTISIMTIQKSQPKIQNQSRSLNRSQVLPSVRVFRLLRQRAGRGAVRGVYPLLRGRGQEHPDQVPQGEAGGGRAVREDAPQADLAGEPARGHRHLVSLVHFCYFCYFCF